MKTLFLFLCAIPLWATSAHCLNTALATGWTCIDGHSEWGTGTQVTTLSPIGSSAVADGDLILIYANLVSANWTSQTISFTDNDGTTFASWSKGLNSYSNPVNQWVMTVAWGVATANKSGYQATCTVNRNGAGDGNCDDFGFAIIRGPSKVLAAAEDTAATVFTHSVSSGTAGFPAVVGGVNITTTQADFVFQAGNSESFPVSASGWTGLDPDVTVPDPFNFLAFGAVQTSSGTINFDQHMNIAGANVGSGLVGLRLTLAGSGGVPSISFGGKITVH